MSTQNAVSSALASKNVKIEHIGSLARLKPWISNVIAAADEINAAHLIKKPAKSKADDYQKVQQAQAPTQPTAAADIMQQVTAVLQPQGGGPPPSSSTQTRQSQNGQNSGQAQPQQSEAVQAITMLATFMQQREVEHENRMKELEAKQQTTSTYATASTGRHAPREDWLVDKMIEESYRKRRIYMNVTNSRNEETSLDTLLRNKLWQAMIKSLKGFEHLYSMVYHGDVYQLMRSVSQVGQTSSTAMRQKVFQTLGAYRKHQQSGLAAHLQRLEELFDEAKHVGWDIPPEQRVSHLLLSLITDNRYKEQSRNCERRNADYDACKHDLIIRARELRNLVDPLHAEQNFQSDTSDHSTKKGDGSSSSKDDKSKDAKDAKDTKDAKQGGGNGRNRRNRRNGNKNSGDDKGNDNRDHKRNSQNKEGGRRGRIQLVCTYFLINGECTNGDDCRFRHLTPEEARDEKNKRKRDQQPQNKSADGKQGGKSKSKEKSDVCFHFAQKGECWRGDKCPFKHESKGEQNAMRAPPAETARRQIEAKWKTGMLVRADKMPTHARLHGVEGCVMDRMWDEKTGALNLLLDPTSSVSVSMAEYMMSHGIPTHMLSRVEQKEEANACYLSYESQSILDTGATNTFVPNTNYLDPNSIHDLDVPMNVAGPNGVTDAVRKAGTLRLLSNIGAKGSLPLKGHVAPNNQRMLVSGSQIDDAGFDMRIKNKILSIYDGDGNKFMELPRHPQVGKKLLKHEGSFEPEDAANRLYPIPDECIAREEEHHYHMCFEKEQYYADTCPDAYDDVEEANVARCYADCDEETLWHNRCGHSNEQRLVMMRIWDAGKGPPRPKDIKNVKAYCASCLAAKIHAKTSRQKSIVNVARFLLDKVWADLCTDMGTSHAGYNHFLTIFEGFAEKIFVYLCKTKAEANQFLEYWIKMATNKHRTNIVDLYLDDGELNTKAVEDLILSAGGSVHVAATGASQHNSKAERPHRTVHEMGKAFRATGGADNEYWDCAIIAAGSVLGKLPTMRALRQALKPRNGQMPDRPLTPDEKWEGVTYANYKDQFRNVVTPFCECVAHVKPKTKKDFPGFRAIYLSPAWDQSKVLRAHLVQRMSDAKRMRVRHVVPYETKFPMIEQLMQEPDKEPIKPSQEQGEMPTQQELGKDEASKFPPNVQHEERATSKKPSATTVPERNRMAHIMGIPTKQGQQPEQKVEENENVRKSQDEATSDRAGAPPKQLVGAVRAQEQPKRVQFATAGEGVTALPDPTPLEQKSEEGQTPPQAVEKPATSEQKQPATADVRNDSEGGSAPTDEPIQLNADGSEALNDGLSPLTHRRPVIGGAQTYKQHFPVNEKVETPWGTATVKEHLPKGDVMLEWEKFPSAAVPAKELWAHEPSAPKFDYKIGEMVETEHGPAVVEHYTRKGEYEVRWPHSEEPQAVYMVPPSSLAKKSKPHEPTEEKVEANAAETRKRSRYEPMLLDNIIGKLKAADVNMDLPDHWHETFRHPFRPHLEKAEVEEAQGLLAYGTFGPPVTLPKGQKRIPLKWVYRAKEDDEGFVEKFKARLAVMGNYMKDTVSKGDAYSPTPHPVSFRILIALHLGDKRVRFVKFDVGKAYLHAKMKRLTYVGHPPGYRVEVSPADVLLLFKLAKGEPAPTTALQLLLALYGAKECGRLYWETWTKWHVEYGFKKLHQDQCYLYLKGENGDFVKMAFHVDDGLVAWRGKELFMKYCKDVAPHFTVNWKDLEESRRFVGMEINLSQKQGVCEITQTSQVDKMLTYFGMRECNTNVTAPTPKGPMPSKADVPTDPQELADVIESFDMYACVGHLNWLQMGTKPEISYPLKVLAKSVKAFGQAHIRLAKHIMRWCAKTRLVGIVFRSGNEKRIQIFTDASHAGCPDTRKSITAVVVKIGGNTVFWMCVFQTIVSHSSTESELMALDKGATLGQFVLWVYECVSQSTHGLIRIFVDNQGTIDLTQNPIQPGRNLHVHARYFYVRDLVQEEVYDIMHLPSALQIADVLATFKGGANFRALYPLIIGCARIVRDSQTEELTWDRSKLQVTRTQ